MNPVRTLIQNATRTGTDVLFTAWDGLNNNGIQPANGVYFYRVEFDGENPVWGKIIFYNKLTRFIKDFFCNSKKFFKP